MNLIIIPFHDWKKSEKEGFRTRDVHLINAINESNDVDKVLIINRPTTPLELLLKNQKNVLKGEKLLSENGFCLYKVGDNKYVTTFMSQDVFGQMIKSHLWFIDKYQEASYINFINDALSFIGVANYNLLVQNVFAYRIIDRLLPEKTIFDAWDNFLKFPSYKKYKQTLTKAYFSLSLKAEIWITNSTENINNFKQNFNIQNIELIRNGVDLRFRLNPSRTPKDLIDIPKPVFGFGGKISYLMDFELINYITLHNKKASFVFVGQILDKKVFNKIIKRDNVYFLGDKHYEIYSEYVHNFDVCIIPYKVGENAHGGDSIKVYEYLLTGKKVVGTRGNGLNALYDYVYLAKNKEEFSQLLLATENKKAQISETEFSWASRAEKIVDLFKF